MLIIKQPQINKQASLHESGDKSFSVCVCSFHMENFVLFACHFSLLAQLVAIPRSWVHDTHKRENVYVYVTIKRGLRYVFS